MKAIVGGKSAPLGAQSVKPRYEDFSYRAGKRLMDITLSLVALVLLSPLYLAVSLWIVLSDGFPIVFRQKRVGLRGREFWILKFRSMRRDAEEILARDPVLLAEYRRSYKLANDPRLLNGGAFMRKTSLDELPQLVNVLRGEMSLVGPRPILARELEEKYGPDQHIYCAMKPGCAGLWQCSGRSDLSYAERVQLDLRYYETASLRNDMMILLKTLGMILSRRGAV